jgi:hypothetical protein
MTAHRAMFFDRVLMDREGLGRANGPINIEQRDITGPPGEPTGAPFPLAVLTKSASGSLVAGRLASRHQ